MQNTIEPVFNRTRFETVADRVDAFLQRNMEPGLVSAVLFFHWLQTLYIDDIMDLELDEEQLTALDRVIRETLHRESPGEEQKDRWLNEIVQRFHKRIRNAFPRRIQHQRDVDRFSTWLADELNNEMMVAQYDDGSLEGWRFEIFTLWRILESDMEDIREGCYPVMDIDYMARCHVRAIHMVERVFPKDGEPVKEKSSDRS